MPPYETVAGQASEPVTFARFIEHLRYAAADAYTIGHLKQAAGHDLTGQGWLGVGQLLERLVTQCTRLAAKGRLN